MNQISYINVWHLLRIRNGAGTLNIYSCFKLISCIPLNVNRQRWPQGLPRSTIYQTILTLRILIHIVHSSMNNSWCFSSIFYTWPLGIPVRCTLSIIKCAYIGQWFLYILLQMRRWRFSFFFFLKRKKNLILIQLLYLCFFKTSEMDQLSRYQIVQTGAYLLTLKIKWKLK